MPSATVRGPYASINTILDPPKFSLDTTFNAHSAQSKKHRNNFFVKLKQH